MIEGVVLKDLVTHVDERGFFREIIRKGDDFFKEGFGQWSHSRMNQGVAKAMLDQARAKAANRWPGVDLIARIKPENRPSRRLFARAGYGRVTVAPGHLITKRSAATPSESASS